MNESFQALNVPQVKKGVSYKTNTEKWVWIFYEILQTLAVHPEDNDHSEEICEDVDPRINFEGERLSVQLGDQVEDPSLVKHGVDLGGEAEEAEPDGDVVVEDPDETDDGADMMPGEHAVLAGHHHLHQLPGVDPEGEGEAGPGLAGDAVQQVQSDQVRVRESQESPDSGDGGIETREVGRPPLGPGHHSQDILGCEGAQDHMANTDDGRPQQ